MDYISEVFSNMSMGFQLMADPIILLYCFAGVVLGAFIGALPGLGPSCGIAILLPATYGMDPTSGIMPSVLIAFENAVRTLAFFICLSCHLRLGVAYGYSFSCLYQNIRFRQR